MSERIIAIGDVHGCSAAVAALVRAIDPTPLDMLVFLGDYSDRGGLARLTQTCQDFGEPVKCPQARHRITAQSG